jgi:hypothetical protein
MLYAKFEYISNQGGKFCGDSMSRATLGLTQSPIQWVPGALSLDQSGWIFKLTTHLYRMLRLRKLGTIPIFPHTSSWHGAYLSTETSAFWADSRV